MRVKSFAVRSFKEIIRDPLSTVFALLLPLVLLIVFQQLKIPNAVYDIQNFTPSIIVFSFSFITLFTATLVAKDRSTSLLARLCASPMKAYEYILGYTLAILPVAVIQNILFFSSALILGLKPNINIIYTALLSIAVSAVFIMLGILIGSVTNERSSSGISSVIVQLVAFTSGMYFSNDMLGKVFKTVCDILPFSHCLNIIKAVMGTQIDNIPISVIVFIAYIAVITIVAVLLFNRKLRNA